MNNDIIKPSKPAPEETPKKTEPKKSNEDLLLDEVSKDEPGPDPKLSKEDIELASEKPKEEVNKTKNPFKKLHRWFKKLTKKKKALVIFVAIILIGSIGFAAYKVLAKDKPVPVVEKKEEVKEEVVVPTTEPSKLTGLTVPIEMNKRIVTGIMIENSPDARPQSGLKDAGVVFEAIAEGGITRFLALFQEAQPDYIGPVRSVRPYYLDWLQGFDAPIAHAGGSSDGLAKIKTDKVRDLDQFANAGAYMRVNNRVAPHNLYTTMAKLDELNKSKGFTSSTFEGFARKEEKANPTPTAKSIDFSISSALYSVHYDYDGASNSYKRVLGGKPHTDLKSNEQLSPKVVIANVMTYTAAYNGVNSQYGTIGSGKAYIFQDGVVTEGSWSKSSSKSQMVWKDAQGNVIKLNPGQTWVTAVNNNGSVTYKP